MQIPLDNMHILFLNKGTAFLRILKTPICFSRGFSAQKTELKMDITGRRRRPPEGKRKKMYRVGIAGCGGIAQVHAAVLHQLSQTRLSACADILPERAEALGKKYGCAAYSSLEEMLEKEKLDAVHLCTPHALHAPMALMAAERGVAVFLEKPPITAPDQWAMLEEAAKTVPVGVCFQNRYNPNVQEARRLMESGELGRVLGARAFVTWHREAAYYTDSGWRGAWKTEGGSALINQSIHTLDLLVTLLGAPSLCETQMRNHHLRGVIETEDTVEAYLILGGKPALFYASTAYPSDAPVLLEIQLEKAALRIEGSGLEILSGTDVRRLAFPTPETLGKGYWGNGHLPCIQDFYRCMEEGRPYPNRLENVRDTAMLVMKMYEQSRKTL